VLFNSAAASFGPRAIGVVLSGTGFDGGDGAGAVQRAGGSVIAQDELTSQFFAMPHAAIVATTLRRVLPLRQIAPALVALATRGALS
jgi:two-component system chemotaxis response regulator CheB